MWATVGTDLGDGTEAGVGIILGDGIEAGVGMTLGDGTILGHGIEAGVGITDGIILGHGTEVGDGITDGIMVGAIHGIIHGTLITTIDLHASMIGLVQETAIMVRDPRGSTEELLRAGVPEEQDLRVLMTITIVILTPGELPHRIQLV